MTSDRPDENAFKGWPLLHHRLIVIMASSGQSDPHPVDMSKVSVREREMNES